MKFSKSNISFKTGRMKCNTLRKIIRNRIRSGDFIKGKHNQYNNLLQLKNSHPPDKTSYFYVNSLLYVCMPHLTLLWRVY